VLKKLLVAEEAGSSALTVTALSDGKHVESDLQVLFSIPDEDEITDAQLNAFNTNFGLTGANAKDKSDLEIILETTLGALTGSAVSAGYGTQYSATGWHATTAGANRDYFAQLATKGGADITGSYSYHISDNVVEAGTGNDVIVLGTGIWSNDTIKWTGQGNGTDTVVNFQQQIIAGDQQRAVVTINLDGLTWRPTGNADTLELTLDATDGSIASGVVSLAANAGFGWTSGTLTTDQIGNVLRTAITTASDWTATYADGVLTLTEKNALLNGTQPGVKEVVIETSAGVQTGGDTITSGTGTVKFNTFDADHIGEIPTFWGGALGVDTLDFTSYGVVAVFLDNTPLPATLPASYTTYHSAFDEDGSSHITSATGVKTAGTGLAYNALTDGTDAAGYAGGSRYITIRQLNTTDAKNAEGVYEIRLWQDDKDSSTTWGKVDAYTLNHKDDDLGLIGIVDFGQELGTTEFTTGTGANAGFQVLF
jgi:hypothetical protein